MPINFGIHLLNMNRPGAASTMVVTLCPHGLSLSLSSVIFSSASPSLARYTKFTLVQKKYLRRENTERKVTINKSNTNAGSKIGDDEPGPQCHDNSAVT